MTNIESKDNIVVVTLSNSHDNCLESPVFIDLILLQSFISKSDAKALIIKGAGRHFSSGADLKAISEQVKNNTIKEELKKGKELLRYIYDLDIPVISAIEGVCFGGGLEIALSTHIRVVSENALLAFPETMHDLMPGLGGNALIKRHLSMGRSIEFILTNKIMSAELAIKEGLADYICAPKSTFKFGYELVEKMTKDKPVQVINSVMKAIKNSYVLSREQAMEEETRMFCDLAKNIDLSEQ